MLTVACVWIKSKIYDNPEWVYKLHSMVRRNLDREFEFLVITPENINLLPLRGSVISTYYPKIKPPEGWPLWWYKLNLFVAGIMGDRVLYLDLDTVVMGSLEELVDYPSDFVMAPTSGVPTKNHDFNSSVMVWNPSGIQAGIIRDNLLPDYKKYPGDQQWISSLKMRIDAFPYRWVHKYLPGKGSYIPPDGTKVALMIQGGKNQALLDSGHSWIEEYWK